jgi:methanogenic corrinoid protein MtbC1
MTKNTIDIEQAALPLGLNLLGQMEVAESLGDPAILADYLGWQKTRLSSQGYNPADISALFKQIGATIGHGLPKKRAAALTQLFNDAVHKIDEHASAPPKPQADLADVASRYKQLLLERKRAEASELILKTAQDGVDVRDIYMHVFQSALYEIGRLWQTNQINVAQEHYFTAATQMIMSQLYPYIFNEKRNGKRMVAASVSDNLHDIGIRMVADFFEMDGWDAMYLGGNNPPEAILQALDEARPHLLALSVTVASHVQNAERVIRTIREQDAYLKTKILVGGHPFNIAPDLWKKIGADGHARSADEAIKLANQLTGDRHVP